MIKRIIPRMRKKSVYLETSFISYLTARPSRNTVVVGHQIMTNEWWEFSRNEFDLYVSDLVISEASAGHPDAVDKRLSTMAEIPTLEITDEASAFAKILVAYHAIPEVARADALHVSLAAINGMNYLLTWNCKHIANAQRLERITTLCLEQGYKPPIICTPEELVKEEE